MKPKYHNLIRKALPVLIILPGMASAAIITPDGFGNVHVTTVDSGPHNIQTGFFPPSGAHTILIDAGATINPGSGDAVEVQVFDASLATYTINNNGTLSALGGVPGEHGIDTIDMAGATPSIIVNNTGTISGFSAIRANDTLTLVNDGTITGIGFTDGAVFAKNGATIDNNSGRAITGNVHGIQSQLVTGTLDINNYGSITGTNFDGITSPGIVTLNNYGTVSGNVNGVIGQGNGSSVYSDGSITGNTGFGVQLGDNATVTNTIYSIISGGSTGVWLDDFATVANSGTITGTTSGLRVSDDSVVTNYFNGLISGNLGIDAFAGSGATFTLNNAGIITGTGGEAINGVLGADTLNLDPGSIINGDINLESGADNINMTSNSSWNNVVNGDIDGGSGTDVLTFTGGKTSPGSTTNIVNGDVTFMQDIVKDGTGTAFIGDVGSFRNVEADAIHVNSGGL
ncbi:MAG: hypothetical protein NTV46_15215, partial [Verrucomicrobia bacterium]|nr:hypothetical protein [Verrucomicrobiota bacterium]